MKQQPPIKRWYSVIAEKHCLGCGSWPVEMAHIELLISPKTGLQLPRRTGINEWAVIPLCDKCHRSSKTSIHNTGEDTWLAQFGWSREGLLTIWVSWFVEWVAGGMKGE